MLIFLGVHVPPTESPAPPEPSNRNNYNGNAEHCSEYSDLHTL